jgi:DNA-binding transcriptional LysR family regulator
VLRNRQYTLWRDPKMTLNPETLFSNELLFRNLTTFAWLAETGNVVRAARCLDVSPNLVTEGLNRLESSIGCRLIKWVANEPTLTREGRALFAAIRGPLVALGHIERLMTSGTLC